MTGQRRLWIVAFWSALVFAYVCAIWPAASAPSITPSDKTDHIIAFFTLSWLIRLAYPRSTMKLTATALFAFGVFIEFSQSLPFIGRDASVADVLADTIAVIVGHGLVIAARRLLPDLFAR